jgi:endonuclease YncB( thermonuclease family)
MAKRRNRRKKSFFPGKRGIVRLVLFLLMLALGLGGGFFLRGRVISVADGDTLTVLARQGERQRIRLYGIDAPEYRQAGHEAATAFVRSAALFSEVELKVIDTDRYGRIVALVTLPDGRTLNEELIRHGHAWVYDNYCRLPICAKWRVMENEAKIVGKGLWADENPTPPWTWRRRNN